MVHSIRLEIFQIGGLNKNKICLISIYLYNSKIIYFSQRLQEAMEKYKRNKRNLGTREWILIDRLSFLNSVDNERR
jgi:hypothetical protein